MNVSSVSHSASTPPANIKPTPPKEPPPEVAAAKNAAQKPEPAQETPREIKGSHVDIMA